MPDRLSENRNVSTAACEVCSDERPSFLVQLTRHDVSEQLGFEPGTLERIVRCCCDRRDCLVAAEDPERWRVVPAGFDPWDLFGDQLVSLNSHRDL